MTRTDWITAEQKTHLESQRALKVEALARAENGPAALIRASIRHINTQLAAIAIQEAE